MATDTCKPPYRVPSMAEVAAAPWNGLTVASTFSGCGGSCLGYRMAGYRVAWANELVPIAAESYRANAPDSILDTRDIRAVSGAEVLAATGLARGELDLLDGSPPCQPFSTAGKREKSWGQVRDYGDHRQRADDLFYEYVRLVDELRPRVFVAENVSGLVKGTAKGYFKRILAALKACGYAVQAKLLDAQWLGVPQARQRIIFVGVRDDLNRQPAFPSPLPYRYSVRDALPWISRGKYGPDWQPADAPSPTRSATLAYSAATSHQGLELVEVSARVIHDTSGQPQYSAGDITERTAPTILGGAEGHFQVETRVIHDTGGAWSTGDVTDRPCPTVTVGGNDAESNHGTNAQHYIVESRPLTGAISGGSERLTYDGVHHLHPLDGPAPTVMSTMPGASLASQDLVERRKFTIGELRRICAFPDDFVLCGTYAEQWARLGNAVPPVMMRHIAEAVRDRVLLPRSV
jgi:DNA (cytosine-5)-methyltransferase 1